MSFCQIAHLCILLCKNEDQLSACAFGVISNLLFAPQILCLCTDISEYMINVAHPVLFFSNYVWL